jgi:hypothetical protein
MQNHKAEGQEDMPAVMLCITSAAIGQLLQANNEAELLCSLLALPLQQDPR